jgi:hypothetical protein
MLMAWYRDRRAFHLFSIVFAMSIRVVTVFGGPCFLSLEPQTDQSMPAARPVKPARKEPRSTNKAARRKHGSPP